MYRIDSGGAHFCDAFEAWRNAQLYGMARASCSPACKPQVSIISAYVLYPRLLLKKRIAALHSVYTGNEFLVCPGAWLFNGCGGRNAPICHLRWYRSENIYRAVCYGHGYQLSFYCRCFSKRTAAKGNAYHGAVFFCGRRLVRTLCSMRSTAWYRWRAKKRSAGTGIVKDVEPDALHAVRFG